MSGLAHDEIVDGYATSEAIHEYFLDNKLYSNLPRKYKVSVTGCAEDCARGLINDIALSAAIHPDGTKGFNLRVGGGLSTQPRFARWVDIFVSPEEAPEVVAAVTGIFRDSEENRKARGKARLKFLVDRLGARRRCAPRSSSASAATCATASRRPRACRARTTSASSPRPTASTARSASSSRSAA